MWLNNATTTTITINTTIRSSASTTTTLPISPGHNNNHPTDMTTELRVHISVATKSAVFKGTLLAGVRSSRINSNSLFRRNQILSLHGSRVLISP